MKGYVAYAMIFVPIIIAIVFGPEIIVYAVQSSRVNDVVEQTTKHAELVGGITPEVEERFNEALKEKRLDPKKFKVEYSRKGSVEHRGKFVVRVTGSYTVKSFNLLGYEGLTLPINGEDSGISEVWIR